MIKKFFGVLIAVLLLNMSICAAAEVIIFHTNDMHSRIQDTDENGKSIGLAEMAAAVKTVKAKNPVTLWFDAGDTFHGMPMITISKGESLVPLLNAAGLDAMTAGNHDFNYGSAQLEKLAKQLKFPLLDANVVRKKNGKLLFKPYKIFKLNGIKIGVFGLSTPETAFKTNPKNVTTVEFLNPVEVSKEMIKQLRPKCDVLIAVMHMGVDASSEFTSERIARETDGIDLIVDGHSHTVLPEGIRIKDTLIVQTGCYEYRLGKATLEVENHKIISKKAELLDAEEIKAIAPKPDKKILEELAQANDKAQKLLDVVVAQSDRELSSERLLVRRNESELGNLAADAFRWAAKSDIAIINGGGLRANLPKGDVRRRDTMAIFPFGNTLRVAEIKGSTIREMLEHSVEYYPASFGGFLDVSGMTFSYDPSKPAKHRVEKIFVGGQPLDENKTYTIALADFQTAGGDDYTMLTGLKIVGELGTFDEILADYLNQVGMSGIEVGRITRLKEVSVPDNK
ncbi:MAG: bifunctional metallophosphatase/5'-nucleotidase [Selenomonadaceae bacterium]|nr:bifunctional metallophosphatase/5'-nucleotidase [Selenomonadaceae bacterium]